MCGGGACIAVRKHREAGRGWGKSPWDGRTWVEYLALGEEQQGMGGFGGGTGGGAELLSVSTTRRDQSRRAVTGGGGRALRGDGRSSGS